MIARRMLHKIGRSGIAAGSALLLALLAVNVASAHAGIEPSVAAPSSNITLRMVVPNEKDVATTQLRLEFPPELIISRFQPKPGWQRTVDKDNAGRVVAATWSGGLIAPGEYDEFTFIARTPKTPGKLFFKAYQTYAGGEVVEWINTTGEDRPAPVIDVVTGATGAESGGGPSIENNGEATTTTEAAAGSGAAVPTAAVSPSEAPEVAATTNSVEANVAGGASALAASGGSDLPLFAALGALVVALIALALAGVALVRRR